MLTFRNTNIFFILVLLTMLGLAGRYHFSGWLFALPVFIYSLILFYGSYYVGSNFFMKVLCSAPVAARQIAISFDDGPARAHTAAILDLLKAQGVPAAFFCIGKNIAGNEVLLQRIAAEGHIIGNHSYSHHFWFDLFGTRKMSDDLEQMSSAAEKVVGKRPVLFRPPYGVTTPNMRRVMNRGGYTAIGWNIRSLDTMIKDKDQLLHKITGRLQPGAIVLLHDTSASTLAMLPQLIQAVRSEGYEFVRVDKLLNITPYA
jgi:peptidoglycan-N-acetylglucosamine deacetylase